MLKGDLGGVIFMCNNVTIQVRLANILSSPCQP